MWGLMGWFSGLVCVGSVAGAVSWCAFMQNSIFYNESQVPGIVAQQYYALSASTNVWYSVFFFMYPVEFLCFIIPKLMLLHRLTNNATRSLQAHAQEQGEGRGTRASGRALARVCRAIAAAVVLCSVGGLVALDMAGAYFMQVAGLFGQAAAACDAAGNNTNASLAINIATYAIISQGSTALSVQAVLEAIALLLICAAYLIIVPLSVAMFRRAERVGANALVAVADHTSRDEQRTDDVAAIVDDTIQAAVQQRRRLAIACVVVLITFPARAAFDLLNAYTSFNDPYNPTCGLCDPCQSDRYFIYVWIAYTPEFQAIAVALSSPLPLAVSLWIITSAHAQAYTIWLNILRARLGRSGRV